MKWSTISTAVTQVSRLGDVILVLRLVRDLVNTIASYVFAGDDDPTTLVADAPTGALFLRTDTGQVYVMESTGWKELAKVP